MQRLISNVGGASGVSPNATGIYPGSSASLAVTARVCAARDSVSLCSADSGEKIDGF